MINTNVSVNQTLNCMEGDTLQMELVFYDDTEKTIESDLSNTDFLFKVLTKLGEVVLTAEVGSGLTIDTNKLIFAVDVTLEDGQYLYYIQKTKSSLITTLMDGFFNVEKKD